MVWVTSTHEAASWQAHSTLPAGALVTTFTCPRRHAGFCDRRHLLFVGGFLHLPNEVVMYFVEHVPRSPPPAVRRAAPVVGTSVPAEDPESGVR